VVADAGKLVGYVTSMDLLINAPRREQIILSLSSSSSSSYIIIIMLSWADAGKLVGYVTSMDLLINARTQSLSSIVHPCGECLVYITHPPAPCQFLYDSGVERR
jgi:hypothetical protein